MCSAPHGAISVQAVVYGCRPSRVCVRCLDAADAVQVWTLAAEATLVLFDSLGGSSSDDDGRQQVPCLRQTIYTSNNSGQTVLRCSSWPHRSHLVLPK
jgi:hypothetical protein